MKAFGICVSFWLVALSSCSGVNGSTLVDTKQSTVESGREVSLPKPSKMQSAPLSGVFKLEIESRWVMEADRNYLQLCKSVEEKVNSIGFVSERLIGLEQYGKNYSELEWHVELDLGPFYENHKRMVRDVFSAGFPPSALNLDNKRIPVSGFDEYWTIQKGVYDWYFSNGGVLVFALVDLNDDGETEKVYSILKSTMTEESKTSPLLREHVTNDFGIELVSDESGIYDRRFKSYRGYTPFEYEGEVALIFWSLGKYENIYLNMGFRYVKDKEGRFELRFKMCELMNDRQAEGSH